MTTPQSQPAPAAAASPHARHHPGRPRLAAAAVVLAVCAVLGWTGGAGGVAAALAAATLLPWLLRARSRPDASSLSGTDEAGLDPMLAAPPANTGRVGAEVMVGQVVPVWSKQMDITREAAATGMAKLLDGFGQMAGALGSLADKLDGAQAALEVGAVDTALADDSPAQHALQGLLAPSQRAFDQRDAAVAALVACSEAMQELRQLGRQAREVGKHTRLVAFNASIEANRSGHGSQGTDNGSQAVANETRMLAARMAEVGDQIERVVSHLDRNLGTERLRGEVGDTTPDELRLELAVCARTALTGLLGALGGAMRSSGDVRQATETLRHQLDESFVNFQFGDRLSQMLAIVSGDMQKFARWVHANPCATQSDAAEWLAKLEGSYTMEAQRAQHHGNLHIDRGREVEFF